MTMNNYEKIREYLQSYFKEKNIIINVEAELKNTSLNENGNKYLYSGTKNLEVISMDDVAKDGYKIAKGALGKPINTVDAFLIDRENEWFFIEFKDSKISSKKDNIEKKGMGNFFMLLDIFSDREDVDFGEYTNFVDFARNKVTYILVCSQDKNSYTYDMIRAKDNLGEKYTPDCLMKFKDYFFKDAYVYTEKYFEKRFVERFEYE